VEVASSPPPEKKKIERHEPVDVQWWMNTAGNCSESIDRLFRLAVEQHENEDAVHGAEEAVMDEKNGTSNRTAAICFGPLVTPARSSWRR